MDSGCRTVPIYLLNASNNPDSKWSYLPIEMTLKATTKGIVTFEGSLHLTPDKKKYDGDVEVIPGERFSLQYYGNATPSSPDENMPLRSNTFEIIAFDPDIHVDKAAYNIGEQVTVKIVQPNENIDPDIIDRFKVHVTSESDTDGFDLWMTETHTDSGEFVGTFRLSKTTSKQSIKVLGCEDVAIEYNCEFPADYADRKDAVNDPSKDFTLIVPVGSAHDSAFRKKRQLMTLQSHVDPQLFERIATGDGDLLPRNKTITIVFWDIRGFSRMCETLRGKEEWIVSFLEEYFSLAQRIVAEHRGIVDKFVGDGVMALFGVFNRNMRKENYESDARDAVEAALQFRDEFKQMITDWSNRWSEIVPRKIDISLRCGINTDEVVVGNIGDYTRSQFTAIGSAVNIASRIEKEANDMQILVTSLTLRKVSPWFQSRKAKVIKKMKNIDGTFECFEIVGRTTA